MKREPEESTHELEENLKKDLTNEAEDKEQKPQDDAAKDVEEKGDESTQKDDNKKEGQKADPSKNNFRMAPKTRIVMIVGYNGSNFCGSQKNHDVRTPEEEIEKSLYKMGCISKFNFGDLKKISWNRATRTDKSVHAL